MMKKFIAFQIMIALVIGALIGHFFPDFGMALRPIGDGFIRLIKMIVVAWTRNQGALTLP
ncbi:C4-dicarboxylate transport protein [Bacillus safensis subsp. safensis]